MTERLVKLASEDYIKVMIDYNLASKKNKPSIDTGMWEKVHQSKVSCL